jgi:hypothetical protein
VNEVAAQKTNIEVANIWIGYVFAKLYENFPMPFDVKVEDIVEATQEKPANGSVDEFGLQLMIWLRDEGYIRGEDAPLGFSSLMDFTVLSERGLHVLNAVPPHLQHKKKIGEQLMEASKDLGKEGVKKVVGDLVGFAIGGMIKSVST